MNKDIYKEIEEYCEINNINDVKTETERILSIGFNIVRFGISPYKSYEEVKINTSNDNLQDKENINSNIENNVSKDTVEPTIKNNRKTKVRIIKNN